MNKSIGQSSFELEETIPGSFLIQGAAAGIVVGFLFVLFCMLWKPNPYNFLLIIYVPFVMTFGIPVCMVKGTIIWALAKFFGLRMRMATRVAMGFLGASLVGVLLYVFGGSTDWRNLVPWMFISLLVAVPTGVLVGSRVRPWRIFTFGTVAVREGDTIHRETSESTIALLASLPLRLVSIAALALSILILAYAWQPRSYEFLNVLFSLIPSAYFALGTYLSFRSPRRAILITLALVINLPVIVMAALWYAVPPGGYFDVLAQLLAIVSTGFVVLWAICIGARLYAPLVTTHPILPIFTSRNQADQKQEKEMCLGSRFTEWEVNFSRST